MKPRTRFVPAGNASAWVSAGTRALACLVGGGALRLGLLLPLPLPLQGPAGSEQTTEGRPRTSEQDIWAVGGVGLDC